MDHYGNKEQGQSQLHSLKLTGKTLASSLPSKGAVPDIEGSTPLQMAVRYGNIACMEQLLASGSSPLVKDKCGYNCLHIAVMFKRKAIFKRLLEHQKITEMSRDTNNEGDLPIHLALQKGLSNFITLLLKSTHHQVMDKDDNNYLHLAALAGDEKIMENLLTYPFAESMMNATNSFGKTPLHCSAISGNPGCIYLLLDQGATVSKCHYGKTPFMYACSEGNLRCAKVLYEAHPFQRDWNDDQGNTALHLAAKSGSPNVTNYCLDVGMVISLNKEQKSFFDIIIEAVDSKLAISVLRHQRWQECLDTSCPTKPHPVMRLIDLIPSAFPVILDQSIHRSPLDPKHEDYWEKYDFKYISLPLGPSNSNKILRDDHQKVTAQPFKLQVESCAVQPEVQLQIESSPRKGESTERMQLEILPTIHKSANYITSSLTEKDEKRSSDSLPTHDQGTHINLNTSDNQPGKDYNVPSLQVLKLLAKKKYKQYLTHPLVEKYLHLKWKDYAHKPYFVKFLLILLWTILLSVFIGISPVPSQLGQTTATNMSASDLIEEEISTAANVIRFITLFFTIVNSLFWLVNIYILRLKIITHFVQEFEFWLYGCAIISTLIYLIPFSGLNSVIHEAGAIAVFTCWVDALVQLEIFGHIGIYVLMLMHITKNVLKVLIICFFLFCAFAFALYILVGSIPELQFTSVGTSLVSSISSALAIVDLETFVALESSLRFHILVFIFYVLLLIMLPIVVINLLIGLAVGDIAQIQADAKINRQIFILTNLARLEQCLSPKVLLRYNRENYVHYPNRVGGSWFKQVMKRTGDYMLFIDTNVAISIGELEEDCPEAREEEGENIEKLQRHIKQLSQTQDRMEAMLQKLMENQGLQCDH